MGKLEVWRLGGLEVCNRAAKGQSWEPIENRFAGLEGLEAREPRGLEARRPGGWENWRSGG